jgi:hypothetical protein
VLVGLLFVAVSVNSAWFSSSEAHRGRAGQALVLFVVPLVTGILLLMPGQSTTALGIEIVVFGLLVGPVLLWLAGAHLGALLAGLLNAWIFLLVAGASQDG